MRNPSPCLGRRMGRDYASHCHSCARHDPQATGYVVIPSFRAKHAAGQTVHLCDDWLSHAQTVAPLARQVCGLTGSSVTTRKRIGRVLGAALVAALCAAYSIGANAACIWADPGSNPYTGNKAAAVRKLTDIPAGTRERLAELVEARAGRHVVVTRDQIDGGRYVGLRDMNFGSGRICPGAVDRSMWPVLHQEGAMVFQEGRYAVLWFSRCGNVAWAEDPKARPSVAQLKEQAEAIKDMGVRTVSEPGTLAMLGAALIAIVVAMRKAR